MKPTHTAAWLLVTGLIASSIVVADSFDGTSFAITANGAPVIERYTDNAGRVRYQLDADAALGMSLGLLPVSTDRINNHHLNSRWLPVFDLYSNDNASQISPYRLPEQSERRVAGARWFWTVGTDTNLALTDEFDIQRDLTRHFSLQSKAGFLIPLGQRWLLGGALTLDRTLDRSNVPGFGDPSGTSVGAFLGVEFTY
ncbi:MAG: hypothetical protein DHS20C01_09180 [marine bacterium B5-7]|nr:MAG: hypothetical protein DHS20C01_09180 [marine bacterium B5-7]